MRDALTSMVLNGKLEPWKGKALVSILQKHEGREVEIIVQTHYPKISGNQNRFLHGVFLPALWDVRRAAGEAVTQEDSRQEFKDKYGPHEPKRDSAGKWTYEPKSVAEWTTKETEDAMEQCRAEYAGYDIQLPFPDPLHNQPQGEQ